MSIVYSRMNNKIIRKIIPANEFRHEVRGTNEIQRSQKTQKQKITNAAELNSIEPN